MATPNHRNANKSRRGPTARQATVSRARSGAAAGGVSPNEVSADSVIEAIALLEAFVSAFEPGRYSGDDAAVLVDQFRRGEDLCATGKALQRRDS